MQPQPSPTGGHAAGGRALSLQPATTPRLLRRRSRPVSHAGVHPRPPRSPRPSRASGRLRALTGHHRALPGRRVLPGCHRAVSPAVACSPAATARSQVARDLQSMDLPRASPAFTVAVGRSPWRLRVHSLRPPHNLVVKYSHRCLTGISAGALALPVNAPWYYRGPCRLASKQSGDASRLVSWFPPWTCFSS
jgi:hypothetical protein